MPVAGGEGGVLSPRKRIPHNSAAEGGDGEATLRPYAVLAELSMGPNGVLLSRAAA